MNPSIPDLVQEHWLPFIVLTAATVVLGGLLIGDGTPIYKQYPYVGQGLLKPWLNWTTADRWRLEELERVGYEKYSKNNQPWYCTFWGLQFLVMPAKYLRDLRTQDRHALNLAKALSDALNMEASVGDVPIANTMEIDVVSKYLNARINDTTPLLSSEATHVFANELGALPDWKQFNAMALSSALVHYISNRILVGPSLCRLPTYRHATESLNMSHVIFGALWNFMPLGPFRKPFYWVFSIPYRMQIRRALRKYIVPIVEERMRNKENDPDFERNLDTIQLMVDMPPADPKEVDSFRHAVRILHLHFASTGSSIALVHNVLWQIMKMPECIEPIREEIRDVKKRYGGWEGKHTLNHLHLLDSFVREVLRVHVPSALVSLRVAQHALALHDGLQLKKGTRIVFPAQGIHFDAANYNSPRDFQPWRFAGSGACDCSVDGTLKDVGRLKAETIDETYLSFGYGKQACPGRFFALKVVKLIIARLLDEYDIEVAGTLPSSPSTGTMEGFFLPTKKMGIRVRSRSGMA